MPKSKKDNPSRLSEKPKKPRKSLIRKALEEERLKLGQEQKSDLPSFSSGSSLDSTDNSSVGPVSSSTGSSLDGSKSALEMAAIIGDASVVEEIAKKRPSPTDIVKALYLAAEHKHTAIVITLLEKLKPIIGYSLSAGNKVLRIAIQNGNKDLVRELLGQKLVDVRNIIYHNDAIPLYMSAKCGHAEIVEMLLKHGAYVSHETSNGKTPLYIAAENGHSQTVEIILKDIIKKGEKINLKNVLRIAAENRHTDTVITFLEKLKSTTKLEKLKLAINTDIIALGNFVLYIAVKNGNIDLIKKLLEKNLVNVNVLYNDGRTSLDIAKEHNYEEITKIIEGHGGKSASGLNIENKKKGLVAKFLEEMENVNRSPDPDIDVSTTSLTLSNSSKLPLKRAMFNDHEKTPPHPTEMFSLTSGKFATRLKDKTRKKPEDKKAH